ncbi:MAG TPA: hypothetical protein VI790_01225 [Candidatus Nanoarchaeia archaeon]|nr:hypothetical protein [Candidatus Nanoarchaeia archaeon]
MESDTLMTTYFLLYGVLMLIVTYKKKRVLYYWEFGIIQLMATIPMLMINRIEPKEHFIALITLSAYIGLTSILIDYKNFRRETRDGN